VSPVLIAGAMDFSPWRIGVITQVFLHIFVIDVKLIWASVFFCFFCFVLENYYVSLRYLSLENIVKQITSGQARHKFGKQAEWLIRDNLPIERAG